MDNDLIIEILNGNIQLFNKLIERYYKEIFKYTYNQIGDYHLSEDIVNEIFLKCYNNLKKFNSKKSSFRTWLYRIASNHIINYLKSKHYKSYLNTTQMQENVHQSNIAIENNIIRDEKIHEIVVAINKLLNKKQKTIINLHYFSGLSVKEIGESLNIPEKTIYKSIKSSIEKIKKEVSIDE